MSFASPVEMKVFVLNKDVDDWGDLVIDRVHNVLSARLKVAGRGSMM